MSVSTGDQEERSTINRVRLWIAIGAGAVTIAGGALALAGAHGDLVHRLDVLEQRATGDTQMRADVAEIKVELRLLRQWFRIPPASLPEVTP